LNFADLKVDQRVIVNGDQDFPIENQRGVVVELVVHSGGCHGVLIRFDEKFNELLHGGMSDNTEQSYYLYSDEFSGSVTVESEPSAVSVKYVTAWQEAQNAFDLALTGDVFETEEEAEKHAKDLVGTEDGINPLRWSVLVLKTISRHSVRAEVISEKLSD